MLLAATGELLALLIGPLLLEGLVRLHPDALPLTSPVVFDARVLLFTLLVSGSAGVLFGLIPALRASAQRLHGSAGGRLVTAHQRMFSGQLGAGPQGGAHRSAERATPLSEQ